MNYIPDLNPYLRDADEYYSSLGNFEETKAFIQSISEIKTDYDEDFSLEEDILIVELKEGVFIRSKSFDWSTRLTDIVKQPYNDLPILKIIKQREWDKMTSNVKYPLNSFGDERLVRWKIGF